MSRLRLPYASIAICVGVFLSSNAAHAQGWLADRSRTEGPGIRLGDFELHPGIGVELGYDSNLYYTSDDADPRLGLRRDSAILRVTPHILFSTLSEQRRTEGEGQDTPESEPPVVAFRGGVSGSYYEFFNDPNRRNFSIDAGLRLTILPERPFSIVVFDDFSRGIRPFTENTGTDTYARIRNRAGLDLVLSTVGNVLQVRAGYRFGLDFFEGESFRYASSFTHSVELQETFRFLPQTALVHDTQFDYRDYFEGGTRATLLVDSVRVRSRIGLNGALTPEISLLGMVGYAAGFFDSTVPGYDQDYDSIVAQVELRWRVSDSVRLALGYDRDFTPSFIGNYYSQDRGYLNGQVLIGGAFLLGAEASIGYLDFGQIVGPTGAMIGSSTERTDVRVTASAFAEYRFTDWLGVNGTLAYTGSFTDFQYSVSLAGVPIPDPAAYNKFEAWLGVRVFY